MIFRPKIGEKGKPLDIQESLHWRRKKARIGTGIGRKFLKYIRMDR